MDMNRGAKHARRIKRSLVALEHAIAQLPDCDASREVKRMAGIHHKRLNKAACAAAEMLETDVTTFSGGGDKD